MLGILKKLVIGIIATIVLFAAVGLLLPANVGFERSVNLKARPEVVYAYLNGFQHFNEWSPWAGLDPKAQYALSGPETGVGARQAWTSEDPNVGSGSQEIIAVTPNERIQIRLAFGGTTTENISTQTITPEGEGSKLVWRMDSALGMNPVNRWFGYFLLEKFVGPDYEKGLAALKPKVEALPAPSTPATVDGELQPVLQPTPTEPVPAT